MKFFGTSVVFLALCVTSFAQSYFFNRPAKVWEETLPLGNGRIGMMPDGGVTNATYVLNESSLWTGCKQQGDDTLAYKSLPEIRRLLFEKKNVEAQDYMYKHFICRGAGSGAGLGAKKPFGSYQPLGKLCLDDLSASQDVSDYRRELNIKDAVATTTYRKGDVSFRREAFTSFSHDVAIIHLSSSKEKGLQFKLRLTRPERYKLKVQGRDLCMFGQLYQGEKDETVNTKDYNPDKGLKYGARVRVLLPQGGRFSALGDTALMIKDATEAVVIIALATDYYKDGSIETKLKNSLAAAETKSYEQLKREHEKTYAKWFGRVNVDFGEVDGRNEMPLDQRMDLFKKQGNDPSLIALYMQFGRYLLISSTRQGALPPNLQGLWCETLTPEWSSDYHTNINLQMNLWPATTGNLSDLVYPTFEWMERLLPNARKTAWAYYHAKGWVNFHIGNVWQFTSPGMYPAWGSCVTLGAWMCTTLYNAFLYTNDKTYLEKLYPMLRECALFFTDILVEDPETHYLITAPTCSPENQYVYDGKNVGVCPGCTMDNQVLRDLFSKTTDAARILGKDEDFCKKLEALSQRLQPTTIAADGRIMEWMQPYQERPDAINFGHVSHLYGLYPSNEISWERTPDLAAAANKSIYVRGGYGHSGWCGAWRSLLCSRLHMGEDAYHFITNLLTCEPETKDAPNWFPNTSYHQIDECFGGCASVMEMLIQSQDGFIDLLPALPAASKSGSFSGLVVRGGGEVSLVWKDKIVEKMSLTAKGDYTFRLKLKPYMDVKRFRLSGSPINTNFTGDILEVAMKKGEVLRYE